MRSIRVSVHPPFSAQSSDSVRTCCVSYVIFGPPPMRLLVAPFANRLRLEYHAPQHSRSAIRANDDVHGGGATSPYQWVRRGCQRFLYTQILRHPPGTPVSEHLPRFPLTPQSHHCRADNLEPQLRLSATQWRCAPQLAPFASPQDRHRRLLAVCVDASDKY